MEILIIILVLFLEIFLETLLIYGAGNLIMFIFGITFAWTWLHALAVIVIINIIKLFFKN